MIVSPLRTTWKRWKRIYTFRYSLLRRLQYEYVSKLLLTGRTLDVGGGCKSSYNTLLQIKGTIESVNFDLHEKPAVVADINYFLPFRNGSFDNVICFNTLEHVFEDKLTICEMLRVLKSGGQFHIMVPFLYIFHGSPDDYHRHTTSWWEKFFLAQGMSTESFVVEPLVWDPIMSVISLGIFRLGKLRDLFMLITVLLHTRFGSSERLPYSIGQRYSNYSLGYYIYGTKQ